MTKMKKAQLILALCGVAVILGAIGFVAITDIFFSDLAAKIVITAALCCFEAALVLRAIERIKDSKLPWVTFGVAVGVLIVMIKGFAG